MPGLLDLYLVHLAQMGRSEAERAIRERVQTVAIGENMTLARVLGHYKMFLRNSDRGFSCHVMLDGYWEIWLTLFLAKYIQPGMTVLDVGANFGYYSLLAADAVGATGCVIAVEPNPDTASLLGESIALNGFAGWTRVEQAAIGRVDGERATLFVPHGEPKNATLLGAGGRAGTNVDVGIRTLDSLAAALARVDLIKIDAEGAESDIVLGMMETLRRHKPALILEFNAMRLADPGGTLDRLGAVYGEFQEITFDGEAVPVSREQMLSTRGEDILLFLS